MKKIILASLLGTALFLPAVANAATGYTSGRVVLRAGPGNEFPRLDRLPSNLRVQVYGCTDRFAWCDVSYGRNRGWVDGDQLRVRFQGRRVHIFDAGPYVQFPLITFRLDSYWGDHYRGRSFYRDRDRWRSMSNAGGRSDRDRDGIPNQYDRDRDGDGTPNRRDDSPNNPRRD